MGSARRFGKNLKRDPPLEVTIDHPERELIYVSHITQDLSNDFFKREMYGSQTLLPELSSCPVRDGSGLK